MQTEKTVFLDLLGMPATRFVIPAYQRLYSWRERQCRELWLDLHRAARADATHFIGTLLYSHEDPDADGRQRLAVIDGQQRLPDRLAAPLEPRVFHITLASRT